MIADTHEHPLIQAALLLFPQDTLILLEAEAKADEDDLRIKVAKENQELFAFFLEKEMLAATAGWPYLPNRPEPTFDGWTLTEVMHREA